jgi:hypothetical protein
MHVRTSSTARATVGSPARSVAGRLAHVAERPGFPPTGWDLSTPLQSLRAPGSRGPEVLGRSFGRAPPGPP